MTNGFVSRFKGKIKAHIIYLGAGGLVDASSGAVLAGGNGADTITAHSGGTRAAAVQLGYGVSHITVVAADTDSVALPLAIPNATCVLINDGAHIAAVFAKNSGTDTIDGVAAATGVALTNAKRAIFYCVTAGAWLSLMGGKSA